MEEVTLEGWAFKQGSKVKNWKKRFFVLRGRALSYYASPPPTAYGAKGDDEKGRVVVVGAELDAPNAMLLVTCERKTQLLKLKPVAPEDSPRWLAVLQRAAGVSVSINTGITSPVGSARPPQVVLKRDASMNANNLFGTDLHDEPSDGSNNNEQYHQQPAQNVAAYYQTAQPLPAKKQTDTATAPVTRSLYVGSTLALDDNQTTYPGHHDDDHGEFDFGDDVDDDVSRRGGNRGALAQGNHIGVARDGWLTVGDPRDKTSWKKRFAVLAGPTLTYFASKGSGAALESVWVTRVSLSSSRANALDLTLDSGRVLGAAADSREELMLWERAFASVLGTSVLLRAASSKEDIDGVDSDVHDQAGGRPSSYTGVFREGWLLLKNGFGRNDWQRRYFVLNGATLQERESPTSKALYESYVVHMTVKNDSSVAEFELELMSGRSLRLQAENTVDAEAWIHALADLVGTPAVESTASGEPQHTAHLPTPVIRPPLNLPPQKVKKTGWLMKEGGLIKSWKRRFFILDGDALHYFDKVNGGLLGGGIVFRVVQNTVTANSLDIHFVNGRILRVSAETRTDIDSWFDILRTAADSSVHKGQQISSDQFTAGTGPADSSFENCQRGWLLKRGQKMKTWKRRYFVIQRNRLTYYDTMGGELLGSGAVFDVAGGNQRPLSLDVRFQNGRLLHVATADEEDYQQWHEALKSASNISESVLSHTSLSQEELPFGKDFDYDVQDEGAGIGDVENDGYDDLDQEDEELSTGYGMWDAAMKNKPGLSRENSWDSEASDIDDRGDESDGVGSISRELRRRESDTPSIPDEPRTCSGWLRKEGELVKNWKRRYFTLHGTTLKYFKSASGSLLRSYEVVQVEESPTAKFGFAIVMAGGRRLVVAAESNDDYEKWLLALWGALADQRASLAGGTAGSDDTRYSAVGVISVKSVPTSPVGSGPPKTGVSTSHSGWLEKEGRRFKTWKRRYFTVKNGALMYFNDMGGEMQGHGTVHGVIIDKTKPNTLRILLAKNRVMRVTAATSAELNAWFQVLSATQKPAKSPRGSSPDSDIGEDFSDIASSIGSAADRRSLGSAPPSPSATATADTTRTQPEARSRFDESDYLKNDTITNESFLRIRGPGDELSLTNGSFYKPRSFKGDLAFVQPTLPPIASGTETDTGSQDPTDASQLSRIDSEDDLEYLRGSTTDQEKREALRRKKQEANEVLLLPKGCAPCCVVM